MDGLRMSLSHLVLALGVLLALAGCEAKLETEDTGGGEDGGGEDGGGEDGGGDDGGGGGAQLDDPRTSAGPNSVCEDYDGTAVAGATGFFFGQYVASADPSVWEGEEQWLLFANDKWREYGEDDCQVTWTTTATLTEEAGVCGSCEYGLTVEATLDVARTSCPEELYEGDEFFSVTYGVDVAGEVATYSYASSGTFVGTGHAVDGASNFLSDGSCLYF